MAAKKTARKQAAKKQSSSSAKAPTKPNSQETTEATPEDLESLQTEETDSTSGSEDDGDSVNPDDADKADQSEDADDVDDVEDDEEDAVDDPQSYDAATVHHIPDNPQDSRVTKPKGRILEPGDDLEFDAEEVEDSNMIVVTEDVYQKFYAFRSLRPSYRLVLRKGHQLSKQQVERIEATGTLGNNFQV